MLQLFFSNFVSDLQKRTYRSRLLGNGRGPMITAELHHINRRRGAAMMFFFEELFLGQFRISLLLLFEDYCLGSGAYFSVIHTNSPPFFCLCVRGVGVCTLQRCRAGFALRILPFIAFRKCFRLLSLLICGASHKSLAGTCD